MRELFPPLPTRPALSVGYLERFQRAMERATTIRNLGTVAGSVDDGTMGGGITIDPEVCLFGKLDSGSFSSGDPMYAWHEILPNSDGSFIDAPKGTGLMGGNGLPTSITDPGDGSPFTNGVTFQPVYDFLGRTNLTAGTLGIIFRGYFDATKGQTWLIVTPGSPGTDTEVLYIYVIPNEDPNAVDPTNYVTDTSSPFTIYFLASRTTFSQAGGNAPVNDYVFLVPKAQYALVGTLAINTPLPTPSYYALARDMQTTATLQIDAYDGPAGTVNPDGTSGTVPPGTGSSNPVTATLECFETTQYPALILIQCDGSVPPLPVGTLGP